MKKLSEEAEQVVIKTKRRVLGVECDICNCFIEPGHVYGSKYFRVITGHNDWGNDSCESIRDFDICPNCISDFITKYVREGRGTEYLRMETEYVYKNDYEYDFDHNDIGVELIGL